ncbi:hypothetical protein C8R45DRAFT_197233 [Mycena sanguinolenta]|nr:hypothetical protein C8R45DRAFT_197233 [Mycena sanguinolenta]
MNLLDPEESTKEGLQTLVTQIGRYRYTAEGNRFCVKGIPYQTQGRLSKPACWWAMLRSTPSLPSATPSQYLSCDPTGQESGATSIDLFGLNNCEWGDDAPTSTYNSEFDKWRLCAYLFFLSSSCSLYSILFVSGSFVLDDSLLRLLPCCFSFLILFLDLCADLWRREGDGAARRGYATDGCGCGRSGAGAAARAPRRRAPYTGCMIYQWPLISGKP